MALKEPKIVEGPWKHRMDSQVTSSRNKGTLFNNYDNPWKTWSFPGLFDLLKLQRTFIFGNNSIMRPPADKPELEKNLPVLKPDWTTQDGGGMELTWLGHATVLVRFDGISVLTDPVLGNRCSPFSFAGPIRYREAPCSVDDLPHLDAVVLSHAHYDHLDKQSVVDLNKKFGSELRWFVPLGLRNWFVKLGVQDVVELDWWDEERLPQHDNVKFAFTPTQHWSNRGLHDKGSHLWGSWCIFGPKHSFFFAGDTGYCEAFKEIGRRYGPFDLSAIPIGAYEPRWFMKPQHVNPEESVKIHQDVESKKSVGIHWGTFLLTNENYMEPKTKLEEEIIKQGLTIEDFFTLNHGETKCL
ncbi:N-acyl-phosphatidylethanolamine-hydrolyzing phospholipase D-like [Anneissia japonica]|uniref:N-acyl-phosphatidylethanolamine-hydrolyzing phospholipase D-like n=1 Tax=Anneissia japonica TaxID=1529436 RepID=UPI001425821F|nr:N-acyl-phosphatidylethanolamine-hydrolyzing phospholipase D-like [Anneissia japonica]